jgi:hypothetical protein
MMIAELNPVTTKLQFQVSTLQEGYDLVIYFQKYSGRFLSMHCQDWVKDPSTKSGFRRSILLDREGNCNAIYCGDFCGYTRAKQ